MSSKGHVGSRSHWGGILPGFTWTILIMSLGVLPAAGQQAATLQQQVEQLKQEYETSNQALQLRIAALEQQIESQKETSEKANATTVSAADLAAQHAAKAILGNPNQVGGKFQGQLAQEPTYDFLREADVKISKLQEQVSAFEFHGYFRSGYGLNSEGGQQVAFEAPGAGAKYRLGNEAETYGEFIFVNNWVNPNQSSDSAWAKTEVMIEANTTNSASYANFANGVGDDQYRLREAFVQLGNVLEFQPGAKFWAGERYYRRQHIDINDFYPLDMSGYGGGVEDFNVGVGKLAVAFLSGARPDIVTQNGNLAKSNIDVRLYGVKGPQIRDIPTGLWSGWFDYATSRGGTTSTGTVVPTSDGYAFGLKHENLEWHGGYNAATIQYGTGAASNFSSSVDNPNPYEDSSARLLVTTQVVVQPKDKFGIMPIFVYQKSKDGNPQHPWTQWESIGARPEVFFTNHVSLAVEAGFDHTSYPGQYQGWVRKLTIAPQIGAGRKFFSRPVLRAFVTYAGWSHDFQGLVGGVPYAGRTKGLTYGVQSETWW